MKKFSLLFVSAIAVTLSSGCSLVKVSEAGKRVNFVTANETYNCTKVGSVSTSVLDNVVGIPRSDEKVQTELDRLARDQAVLVNANTLVRESIRDGLGSYTAYNCP